MKIYAIKTHLIQCGESFIDLLDRYIVSLPEASVIAISGKIVSICQSRIVEKNVFPDKYDLIKKEADAFLAYSEAAYGVHLTIKNNMLIPFAGIDESNGDDVYILYPEHIQETLSEIWQHLRQKHGVRHLGILLTDSHLTPLRKGVTGISLGCYGFNPLYSYIGTPDLHGRPFQLAESNIADALATAAVFMMGEGAEQTPIAIAFDLPPHVQFWDAPMDKSQCSVEIPIPIEKDVFAPLLRAAKWIFSSSYGKLRGVKS